MMETAVLSETVESPRRGRPPKTMFHVKQSERENQSVQKPWVLRYKYGNHPAQTGTILASSAELAEAVGRAWCLKKGAGQMQVVRYISVEDPVLADETILTPHET